jgi:ABC-type Zn uptake system ZnuABC Zn-binding protein ZnuA
MRQLIFIVSLLFVLEIAPIQAQNNSLQVVASSTIIADIVQNVGGDLVSIAALVPANTDTHAFKPLPADLRALESADLILINGAGLEQFLGNLLADIAPEKIIVIANGVSVLPFGDEDEHEEGDTIYLGILGEDINCDGDDEPSNSHAYSDCDPHFWTDPTNVMLMAENIAATFAELDPENAEIYQDNAATYIEQLAALDNEIREILSVIPSEERVLVTNHEFLGYFANAYNFEIIATVIPSVSTIAEPSPRELAALVELIEQEEIPAIFAEISATVRVAGVVASEIDHEVKIVSLYSGSLSEADGVAATYIDYMRFNAQAIADALTR